MCPECGWVSGGGVWGEQGAEINARQPRILVFHVVVVVVGFFFFFFFNLLLLLSLHWIFGACSLFSVIFIITASAVFSISSALHSLLLLLLLLVHFF